MKRLNKTLRRKKQRRQRSRRHSHRKNRHTRRQKGGSLPVPAGSVVAISTGGEYGVPILMSKEKAVAEQESGSLEE
jgi:hypothetical protein